jgi:ubiquinone/menaquinone biosynthesis C-methylase UbiE
MGFYARHIFPRLMHWSMSRPEFAEQRRLALADVAGEILEIGFGTGLNLPAYPDHVRKITAVDRSQHMGRLAARQLGSTAIEVELQTSSAEQLPMDAATFDSVVSTFTLCSIADLDAAFREIRRVLKSSGRFFFLEHGLSPQPRIARWQHRLSPISRWLGEGCNMDRPIRRLVENGGFRIELCEEFYVPRAPKLGGYLYRGVASIR